MAESNLPLVWYSPDMKAANREVRCKYKTWSRSWWQGKGYSMILLHVSLTANWHVGSALFYSSMPLLWLDLMHPMSVSVCLVGGWVDGSSLVFVTATNLLYLSAMLVLLLNWNMSLCVTSPATPPTPDDYCFLNFPFLFDPSVSCQCPCFCYMYC